MRYLNKIVFINSASVRYAEINIDGNVHFIGTQGVGKSTTLRAILFFYNADKLRLGIEKGKRSFDEYYFPFGNSYIIYEVVRETGPFCVMAFKSQGRVAFRFIDGAYDKQHFIGEDSKALPWEQVRGILPKHSAYTRKVDRYDEFRDILYGNNKGLPAEFRKYALLESRQYKNLPRTIQNVFLNSKLEAEFIKQTIIMSLNEEDVKIDLNQYALHLRNFEERLADISKWSTKNRAGEIVVRVVAEKISGYYTKVRYLKMERERIGGELVAMQKYFQETYPQVLKSVEEEQDNLDAAQRKVKEADAAFEEIKTGITANITVLEEKLKESGRKREEYTKANIGDIIQRVSKRQEWGHRQKNLEEEHNLLSAQFQDISSQYEVLMRQVRQQLEEFLNSRNKEKNSCQGSFYDRKEQLSKQYDRILQEIEAEGKESFRHACKVLEERKDRVHALIFSRKEIELKKYFEAEISRTKEEIREADVTMQGAKVDIANWESQISATLKQWELEKKSLDSETASKVAKLNDAIEVCDKEIQKIDALLSNSRDSLYAWLHDNKPGWEHTIGKVIDEEQVLFQAGLSPRISSLESDAFYGVELELSEINTKVKSVADYEAEKERFIAECEVLHVKISALDQKAAQEKEQLKVKYQPILAHLKKQIEEQRYAAQKALSDKEQAEVKFIEWERKAVDKRQNDLLTIQSDIESAQSAKLEAEEQVEALEESLQKQLSAKRREREEKISKEQAELQERLQELDGEIEAKKQDATEREAALKAQSLKALEEKGADTGRLSAIEQELQKIEAELSFIEEKRDLVADYRKDKRELFDLEDEFKADKELYQVRLHTEKQKHQSCKKELLEKVQEVNVKFSELKASASQIEDDLQEFESFAQTSVFRSLSLASIAVPGVPRHPVRLTELIRHLTDKHLGLTDSLTSLRTEVNRFLSHFSVHNIFGFKTSMSAESDYLDFAENLKEFLDEDKIAEFERRTNEHFATLIRQIGKETTDLVSKEAEIQKVILHINRDFEERNFAGVIKSIQLRLSDSAHKIVVLLQEIRTFNNEYSATLGTANLFSTEDSEAQNRKAVSLLKRFATEISSSKQHEINLSDTFELEFRIIENDNDSGWVEKLANVGSEGTDILVKAMINIMLLNVFKESASKRFKDFRLHCMMDEIGKLHPNNVKGILKFANDRNILLVNSSPTTYNAMDYRYTYLLAKDSRHVTTVKKLIKNNVIHEAAV
ncbi:ATP-binding protein [Pontibacter chinhatensis]|uniref:ATP-binding protein n=1 Tax=Pontibacter chinhatensis TaxID=1436961 RepID=A0A1I2QQB6_9BACT|nr:ATP-binding protein [Pontibacter chinhatensis]SFG27846.1 Protein of unknown function [Pontibacter chinhatensis]